MFFLGEEGHALKNTPLLGKGLQANNFMEIFCISAKEKKKRRKKKANIAQIENVEFDDEENADEGKSLNERNPNSADVTSPTLTSEARRASEGSRSEDNANYKSIYATGESREIHDNSRSSSKYVPNASGESSGFTPTSNTQSLVGKRDNDEPVRSSRTNTPKLNISLENSRLAQNSQNDTSDEFLEETRDEPLVDLNSGVSLTPVACPDEAKAWALAESDDSESPGNESGVGFPVTSRLFPGAYRESPGSR
jgi:hypothetical protein